MYQDYIKTVGYTNNSKTIREEKKDITCIICWQDDEIDNNIPTLLKQNTNFITFCDCNTYIHDVCLNRWYCRTFSCPICRLYLIYDPDFTNNERIRRKIFGAINYGYNIVKQITNIISVFVAWNITLNILCNIYLSFYPIDIKK